MNKDFIVPDEVWKEPLAVRIAMIDQAKQLFGVEFAKGLWVTLGLPTVGKVAARQRRSFLGDQIDRFIRDCLNPDPLSEVKVEAAYAVYRDWSSAVELATLPATTFGRLLKRAGIASRRSNNTIYCGIRIKPGLAKDPDPSFDFGHHGHVNVPGGQQNSDEG